MSAFFGTIRPAAASQRPDFGATSRPATSSASIVDGPAASCQNAFTHLLGKPPSRQRGESRHEGVSPMVPTSSRKAMARALAVAGLLLAGLFLLNQLAPAQSKDKDKAKDGVKAIDAPKDKA